MKQKYLPNEVKDVVCMYTYAKTHNNARISSIYYMFFKEYYFILYAYLHKKISRFFLIRGVKRVVSFSYIDKLHVKLNCKFTLKNYKYTVKEMNRAALNNRLNTVKWLHTYRKEGCTEKAMNLAAKYGHLDVIQWLHVNREEGCTPKAMDLAAEFGHLDVVQWLHENYDQWCTRYALNKAASNGHLDIVKYLVTIINSSYVPHSYYDIAIHKAIVNNYTKIVEFLKYL